MSHSRLWVVATIIAVVVVVGFVLSVPHTRDIGLKTLPTVATSTPTVVLHDGFKKGLHTITGSVETPNACTVVNASAVLVGDSLKEQSIQVMLSFPKDSGVCLQVSTRTNFSTTVSAPAHLPLTATVNGVAASTTPS